MEKFLMYRVKKGAPGAFAELYNQHAEYALRVATAITRSEAAAADAVQEAFIRVYKNVNRFDISKPFEPWFYRILVNECNRILKTRSKTVPISNYLENESRASREDYYKFQEYEELYCAISELEDHNRIPIILKYLKGFKEAEIAQILGVNLNTLKSRLYKGRQKLKKALEKDKKA